MFDESEQFDEANVFETEVEAQAVADGIKFDTNTTPQTIMVDGKWYLRIVGPHGAVFYKG